MKILQQWRDADVKHMSLANKHKNAPLLAANMGTSLYRFVGENSKQHI